MEAVTYSLSLNNSNSDEYYSDVRKLTNEVILKAEELVGKHVVDYMNYLREFNLEVIREREEYILEFLSFGVLWNTYSKTALSIKAAPFILLSQMGEWRKKHQKLKPLIDFARGALTTLFLLPKVNQNNFETIPTLEKIDRVCLWFEATGEFREQALRFVRWRAFLSTLKCDQQEKFFYSIAEFRNWFENTTLIELGKYTSNVDAFLGKSKKKYRWREDRISCSRTRVEYHLNMVGAELMNRAFRKDFIDTDATALLLPGCMRIRLNDECEANREPKGLKCVGCDTRCRVNEYRKLGEQKNFEVYVIPHASDLSQWSPKDGSPRKGVVASACVTTLVEGGWELKRYGVPAQCVLLDYSGCKKHWHPEGMPTHINKHELERIILN
jgi:hypothetical protein